jgi:predicted nucleic acid-binding protein
MIIIDTNVISELMRPTPAPAVLAWLGRQADSDLYTTAITLAEIRYGIGRLPAGRRQEELLRAADEAFGAFPEQVLPFDAVAAHEYADLVAARERAGNPIDGFDGQIAAICRAHDALLATRNTRDFEQVGVALTDPWLERGQA